MATAEWKQRIYDSYMSTGFQDSHSMKKEFELHGKYFRKNYLKFMPQDKNARILELGCGMGQFYNFCRNAGYTNYEGIDASSENVSFIKETFGEDSKVSVTDILDFLAKFHGGGTTQLYSMT